MAMWPILNPRALLGLLTHTSYCGLNMKCPPQAHMFEPSSPSVGRKLIIGWWEEGILKGFFTFFFFGNSVSLCSCAVLELTL